MSERESRNAYRIWNLLSALGLALVAVVAVPVIFGDLGGERGLVNWFLVLVGTFFTGMFFWWLLIGRPREPWILRGVLVGLAVDLPQIL